MISKKRYSSLGYAVNKEVPSRRMLVPVTEPMTYEEFLNTDFENPHVEWVGGRAVAMSPTNEVHQDLNGLLIAVLRTYVEERKLGVIQFDPFQMKLEGKLPGRAPDIMFVAKAHKKRLKKTCLKGPADLVVEIISPGSRGVDRGNKFREYESGGVPEYWLIDPERKQAEFYLLNRRGIYQAASLDSAGVFHSVALPGMWVKAAWCWQTPLPTALSILRQWKLV